MSNRKKSDPFGVPVTVFNTVQGKTCSKTLLSKNRFSLEMCTLEKLMVVAIHQHEDISEFWQYWLCLMASLSWDINGLLHTESWEANIPECDRTVNSPRKLSIYHKHLHLCSLLRSSTPQDMPPFRRGYPFPLFFQACLGLWFCAAETTPESTSHTTGVLDMLISPGSALGRWYICGFYSLSGVAGQNCCYYSTYRNIQLRKEVLWKEDFIRQCQTLELGFSDWMDGTAIRLKRS